MAGSYMYYYLSSSESPKICDLSFKAVRQMNGSDYAYIIYSLEFLLLYQKGKKRVHKHELHNKLYSQIQRL